MIISRYCQIMLLGICLSVQLAAQKKIVVLGSSTAAGTGASTFANSWVGKMTSYYNQNNTDGLDTTVSNLSLGGNHSYSIMPSGYTPPPGRPFTDDSRNITAALALNPDVIIVNLPTNDVFYASNGTWANYTIHETMENFRYVESIARAAGKRIFFATAQPRNLALDYRDSLRRLKDSMVAVFHNFYIDFWTDLVETDGSNTLKASVNSGDGIHVNDVGHNFLFTRVINKGIFGTYIFLPLHLLNFAAIQQQNEVKLSWTTELEDPVTLFTVEVSTDGLRFESKTQLPGSGNSQKNNYTWTDPHPRQGINYYRIHITENNKETYTKTIPVWLKYTGISVSRVYTSRAGDQLLFTLTSGTEQAVNLRVINANGSVLSQQSLRIREGVQSCTIPVNVLSAGMYYLQVITENNQATASPFTKL